MKMLPVFISLFFTGICVAGSPSPTVVLPPGYVYQFGDSFDAPDWVTTEVVPYKSRITTQNWYAMQPDSKFMSLGYAAQPPGTVGYPFATNLPGSNATYLSMGWWKDSTGALAGCFLSSVDQTNHGVMGPSLPHPGAVRHGYFEGCFLFPVPQPDSSGSTSGLWPAFWFQPIGTNAKGYVPELDGFELYSIDGFSTARTTWHIWGPNHYAAGQTYSYDTTGAGCLGAYWKPAKTPPNFCDGKWHTWGLLVTATHLVTYLDGKLVWDTPNPDDTCYGLPLYVNVDCAFGGGWPVSLSWAVPPYPGTGGPSMYSLKVAYLRVWANPSEQ